MKFLAAYYRYNRSGSHARDRCQEHAINAKGEPLCGYPMDDDQYVWKELNTAPHALCRKCTDLLDQKTDEKEQLRQWTAGEPIR